MSDDAPPTVAVPADSTRFSSSLQLSALAVVARAKTPEMATATSKHVERFIGIALVRFGKTLPRR